jgi:predicted phosphodiesterase
VDGSAETWRDDVVPDMNAYRASLTQECYTINLGDLIYNYPVAYDDYMDVAGQLNSPVFNVIGNHDFDQRNLYSTSLGTPYFNIYTGPENYSFNIGKMHFVVLNDIIYDRKSANDKYKIGLEDSTLEWLRQDLQFIPKENTVVIAVHGQLFMSPKGNGTNSPNFAKYSALLKDYAKVYCWAGHYHNNFGYDYAGKGLGLDNIETICVSRATGSLRVNRYLNNHGVPQGYMVAEVDGGHMSWCYKAVGKSMDQQMTVYEPSAVDGINVAVNVWNWNGDTWGVPQWWENGQKVADMARWKGKDPNYVKLISDITDKYLLELAKPAVSRYLFRIKPTEGVTSGEVRVEDNFGNVYIKSISW